MHHRRAAHEAQPRRRHRDREAERIGRGLLVGRQEGRGHDQDLVGIGAQGRDHARAVDDDAGVGFFYDFRREVLFLALDRARAIDLRVQQRVRHAQIALAGQDVIGADIVGETRVAAAEFRRGGGQPGDHHVEEIGAAAEHAAGRVHPELYHLAAADQVIDRARLDKGQPDRLAARRRGKAHAVVQRRVVLHVVKFGEALRRSGKARVGGDVAHPLAVDKDPPVVVQGFEKLLAGANGHVFSPPPFSAIPWAFSPRT